MKILDKEIPDDFFATYVRACLTLQWATTISRDPKVIAVADRARLDAHQLLLDAADVDRANPEFNSELNKLLQRYL